MLLRVVVAALVATIAQADHRDCEATTCNPTEECRIVFNPTTNTMEGRCQPLSNNTLCAATNGFPLLLEQTGLPAAFCGRGTNRMDCPEHFWCNISPVDVFAVCCPTEKSGLCPLTQPSEVGICANTCSGDQSCSGDLKCCSTACGGKSCTAAVKPGACPALGNGTAGTCQEECQHDQQCTGTARCCSNGCGHTCQTPVNLTCENKACPAGHHCIMQQVQCFRAPCPPLATCVPKENEGECPALPSGTFGTCVEACSSDSDCQKEEKCCSNGCGHTCQKAVIPPPPSCLNKTCGEGEKCIMQQQKQCLDSSCHPQPTCVKGHCYDPPVSGPCEALMPRYYFNTTTRMCHNFNYGGCEGNDNNFQTAEACMDDCAKSTHEDRCHLPPESGMCMAYFRNYFYNRTAQQCQQFIYGGCQGNKNNFETEQECSETCGNMRCKLQPDTGPCRARFSNYFYNWTSQQCEQFIYGGCAGNENNFKTQTQCDSSCGKLRCHLPSKTGPCKAAFRRYFYNKASKRCESFTYGGCQGNENNFETEKDCSDACTTPSQKVPTCKQLPETGMCRAFIQRYFYNSTAQQCQTFVYGGCQGNDNNFETATQCQDACGASPSRPKELTCKQPPEPGMCRAYMERYFYNSTAQQCQTFVYGGCQGNDNNFETKDMCEDSCGNMHCKLQPDTGPCSSRFMNYFFNWTSQQCEQFTYGGCSGNDNNFRTQTQCDNSCGKLMCHLPRKTGPCRAAFRRYFYNKTSQSCEEFTYGGCLGNENNFETEEDCSDACAGTSQRDLTCQLPPKPGMCRAYMERYFYNSTAQQCQIFVYGGCQANANNFETEAQCQDACGDEGTSTGWRLEASFYILSLTTIFIVLRTVV